MRIILVAFLFFNFACTTAKKDESQFQESGYAAVNGINIYYEVYGKGDIPLILLHGGGSTLEVTYEKMIPLLSKNRRVIAVEEQGHGRTSDRNAPATFETSADDVAGLIKHLNIPKADIMGFSNGAQVAIQVAIRHPQLVNKLIFASAFTKRSGAIPDFWKFIKTAKFENMPQPLKDAYLKVNPNPEKLKTMHDKDAYRIQNFKDMPDKDIATVKAPTLIMMGDKDIVRVEHAAELARLIKDARIAILPGNHGDYLGEMVMNTKPSDVPKTTAGIIEEFLK